jgi:hypothetical protein
LVSHRKQEKGVKFKVPKNKIIISSASRITAAIIVLRKKGAVSLSWRKE